MKYELCVQRLEQAVAWKNQPEDLVDIELYAGLCHFNLSHTDVARAHFELALRLNRSAALPPFSPPRAVALFQSLLAQLPPPADAPVAVTLIPDAKPSEQVPLVKPQRQKTSSPVLPLSLGGASLATAAGGTVLLVRALALASQANQEPFESRAIVLGDDARASATWSYVLFGFAGAMATAAITTAVISVENAP